MPYPDIELYHLDKDIAESSNVAKENPEKVAELMKHAEAARAELGDKLTKSKGSDLREPGRLTEEEGKALDLLNWPNGKPKR